MSVKAFELVPAIEREQLIGDKSSNTSIECIECCGADFFIGTSDGSIIKYVIKEEAKSSGKNGVKATKVRREEAGVSRSLFISPSGRRIAD